MVQSPECRISIVMAADERYVAPLSVTIRSLLEHLRPGVGVDLHLLSSGITPPTRRRLEAIWNGRVRAHWTPLEDGTLASLRGYGYTSSPAANFRLLIGSSLPSDVSKVIYLDADLLVRKDIVELWERDMRGKIVLAVQDSYVQTLPAHCLRPSDRTETPRPYFNSGVMVIDLKTWRAAGIEQRCLETASRLQRRTKMLDQDTLNVCLATRWGPLPPVWNRQFAMDLFPDWQCSPYDEHEFLEARSDPAIIHFCTRTKPWHAFCDHRPHDVVAYRAALRGSAFGADLGLGPSLLQRIGNLLGAPHRRLLDTTATAFRARRRRHALRAMLPDMLRLALLHPWTVLSVPLAVARERLAIRFGIGSR